MVNFLYGLLLLLLITKFDHPILCSMLRFYLLVDSTFNSCRSVLKLFGHERKMKLLLSAVIACIGLGLLVWVRLQQQPEQQPPKQHQQPEQHHPEQEDRQRIQQQQQQDQQVLIQQQQQQQLQQREQLQQQLQQQQQLLVNILG